MLKTDGICGNCGHWASHRQIETEDGMKHECLECGEITRA